MLSTLQCKRTAERNKRLLQRSSSMFASGLSQSSKSLKSASSSSSQEQDSKIPKRSSKHRSAKRGTASSSIPEEKSKNEQEEECEDLHTCLLKLSTVAGNKCSCVCLDAKHTGKWGEKFCGWEPQELTCDTRNPYHFPIISGEKELATVPEEKIKRKPALESRLTSAKLGYIPTTNQVKHYPFHHCLDDDTSVYIREYREKYTCKNSIAKGVGSIQTLTTNLPSKVIPFGLDQTPGSRQENTRGKVKKKKNKEE